jgi:hypothetical protein
MQMFNQSTSQNHNGLQKTTRNPDLFRLCFVPGFDMKMTPKNRRHPLINPCFTSRREPVSARNIRWILCPDQKKAASNFAAGGKFHGTGSTVRSSMVGFDPARQPSAKVLMAIAVGRIVGEHRDHAGW